MKSKTEQFIEIYKTKSEKELMIEALIRLDEISISNYEIAKEIKDFGKAFLTLLAKRYNLT